MDNLAVLMATRRPPRGLAASLRRAWARTLPAHPELGADLLRRWQQPHRHYHDLRHLAEALIALTTLGCTDPAAQLALWFHDAVLDLRPDGELRSAALAVATLTAAGCPSAFVAEVERLVLVTTHTGPDPADPLACAVSDADLWVLAAAPTRYDASVADLRREYRHVSDASWLQHRRSRLTAWLDSPVYFSAAGVANLQVRARANLERELRQLRPLSPR